MTAADDALLRHLAQIGLVDEQTSTGLSVHANFAVQETDAYLEALLANERAAAQGARVLSIAKLVARADDYYLRPLVAGSEESLRRGRRVPRLLAG